LCNRDQHILFSDEVKKDLKGDTFTIHWEERKCIQNIDQKILKEEITCKP
jgi:hypothetical protein